MGKADMVVGAMQMRKRMFQKISYRGDDLDALLGLTFQELQLFQARA